MSLPLALRFLGVGSAQAADLGCSSGVLEAGDEPLLLIDCGLDTLAAFAATYGQALPTALFITHVHFDHVGGLEGLFYRIMTGGQGVPLPRLYIPVELLPVLQRRMADYPNILAEGGVNFWDAFHLVPVSDGFWHRDLSFSVFPVRHHALGSAFGLALEGRFFYSGDTRPIPEVVVRFASHGEIIFHDCASVGSPSHTGLADLAREYQDEQRRRMVLYHYESPQAAELMEREGFVVARRGERFLLAEPLSGRRDARAVNLTLAA